jgi:general secretion pathway protein M
MNREQLLNWYATLSPRDQRVLNIGAVAVVLILLVGVFLPLQLGFGKAKTQLQTQQQDLEWMKQVAPTLAAAGPGPGAADTQESLVVLIDRSARESGLAQALTGTRPAGNGAMRVQLDHADFNLLTAWLSRLSAQHGVRVEAASFTSGSSPGTVTAAVQLRTR